MHSWISRILASALAATSIAAAPVALAVASPNHDSHSAAGAHRGATTDKRAEQTAREGERSGESATAESDGDSAAQAAACAKAGVSGDNVQYDDQTATCSANAGSGSQQQG